MKVSIKYQEIFKMNCSGLYKPELTTQSSDSSSRCHTACSKICRFL